MTALAAQVEELGAISRIVDSELAAHEAVDRIYLTSCLRARLLEKSMYKKRLDRYALVTLVTITISKIVIP